MMIRRAQYIDEVIVNIDVREVLRLQGRRRRSLQLKKEIQHLVESQIAYGYKLIQPRGVFSIFLSCISSAGKVTIEGGEVFSIGRAAENWSGLKEWALAICTIGKALEEEVSRLFTLEEYAAAAILDSVGSVAVESLADYINSLICRQVLEQGLGLAPRISPGYGVWPLEEQRLIFELLPAEKLGVTLNERYMMQPRKSISFGVGIGQGFTTERGVRRCRHCGMIDCPYRIS